MGKLCFRRKPSGVMFVGRPSHLLHTGQGNVLCGQRFNIFDCGCFTSFVPALNTQKAHLLNMKYIVLRSATTWKPLTGEMNNINYLITTAHVNRWDILGSIYIVIVLEAGKMGKYKDLSNFDTDG